MFDIDIERILLTLPGILVALSFHEFAHGMTSYLLGDPTPKNQKAYGKSTSPHRFSRLYIADVCRFRMGKAGYGKPQVL